jgi:hypothetical protein
VEKDRTQPVIADIAERKTSTVTAEIWRVTGVNGVTESVSDASTSSWKTTARQCKSTPKLKTSQALTQSDSPDKNEY